MHLPISIADINLHAARTSNPAMQEADPLDHRLEKFKFAFKASIDHLAARIPVREVAIELKPGENAQKLHRPPHVLEDSCTMRLHIQRYAESVTCFQDGFDQAVSGIVVFETPSHMQRKTFKIVQVGFGSKTRCIARFIHATATAYAEADRQCFINKRRIRGSMNCTPMYPASRIARKRPPGSGSSSSASQFI